jgi:hypothetical protein
MPFTSSVAGKFGFEGIRQGAGVTLVLANTAVTEIGPNNTYSGYTDVDDSSTAATINAFFMNGTSHTTVQLCTNNSIHFSTTVTGGYNSPLPCINIGGPTDRRGGNAAITMGTKLSDPNVTWTRLWITWHRWWSDANRQRTDMQYEIYFVRDVTASKQYIQVACYTNVWINAAGAHNINLTGTLLGNIDNATVNAGNSWVWEGNLTGTTWTLNRPGSLTNFK